MPSMCSEDLRQQGLASPKTCVLCDFGPCKWHSGEAAKPPDYEVAQKIRTLVAELNTVVAEAGKREIIIRYDIKPQNPGNPALRVQILTEVA